MSSAGCAAVAQRRAGHAAAAMFEWRPRTCASRSTPVVLPLAISAFKHPRPPPEMTAGTVLVTGASGYTAQFVVQDCAQRGWQVRAGGRSGRDECFSHFPCRRRLLRSPRLSKLAAQPCPPSFAAGGRHVLVRPGAPFYRKCQGVQGAGPRGSRADVCLSRRWQQEGPLPLRLGLPAGRACTPAPHVSHMGAQLARIQKEACMHQADPACRWTWPAERACPPAWMLWGLSQREPATQR